LSSSCPVCVCNDLTILRPYVGTNPVFDGLTLMKCNSCGMVFADPLPSKSKLDDYNATYFDSAHGGHSNNKIALAFFSGIARLRMSFINRYLIRQGINVMRLMEIGPGIGFFAKNWLKINPKVQYFAIESDYSCHLSLRNLGVTLSDMATVMHGECPVDLTVMSHVLEHVGDPVKFLGEITTGLRPGGAIFIEVPCQDWMHKTVDEPHLLFFEKKSMLNLLEKLGFIDIELSYVGEKIATLKHESRAKKSLQKVRNKLLQFGCITPFSWPESGMEDLNDPLERAAVKPYKAHCESNEPAWWLRAIARKP
jgi:SAM-dependent methyltransferase